MIKIPLVKLFALITIYATLTSQVVLSQEPGSFSNPSLLSDPITPDPITPGTIVIQKSKLDGLGLTPLDIFVVQNPYPFAVEIQISSNQSDWLRHSINYGEPLEVSCDQFSYVKIVSYPPEEQDYLSTVTLLYEIECNLRYSVFWNLRRTRWEIVYLEV